MDAPAPFLWGAATAAYQIEGAVRADGRGASIWDVFSHTPGKVAGGDTGDIACDHYSRMGTDVELMAWLGLSAYRFSIAWPRIQPEGRGKPNRRGLDAYRRLVELLLGAGIAPVPTLYHWDLPQALQERGGWDNRDTAHRFADYAEAVHGALGDVIPTWFTINEPEVAAFLGHVTGVHAPGLTDPATGLRAAHHLLLGHGEAAQALRAGGARGVGIVLNLSPVEPHSDRQEDLAAAERLDAITNRLFLDATLLGGYPPAVLEAFEELQVSDAVRDTDAATIAQPLDGLGVNYYFPRTVRHAPGEGAERWPGVADVQVVDPAELGQRTTAMGWPVAPGGLTDTLLRLHREYPHVPLFVTENGAAYDDEVGPDGSVNDRERRAYLQDHVAAAQDAVAQGVDLRGYFVWSLLDNFEWAEGYAKRFGIVHVDYQTLQRTPKASARWYRAHIAGDA